MAPISKKQSVLGLILLIAGVVFLFAAKFNGAHHDDFQALPVKPIAETSAPKTEPDDPLASVANEASDAADQTAQNIPDATRSGTTSQEYATDPISSEIRDWFNEVGVLTGKEAVKFLDMPRSELEQAAASGNIMAKSALGLSLAKEGNYDRAETMLMDAIIEGSIGAAILLRDLNMGGYSDYGLERNVVQVYTWERIAQILGNPPTLGQIAFDDENEEALAIYNFYETLRLLQSLRQERYGDSLPYNPQPRDN
jgi:hypothetical protein